LVTISRGGTGKFSKIKILEKYIFFSSNIFILRLTLPEKKIEQKKTSGTLPFYAHNVQFPVS